MPPVGFKRSRALWDNARRPHASTWDAVRSYTRAIIYELQPVRSSELPSVDGLFLSLRRISVWIQKGLQRIPGMMQWVGSFLTQRMTRREWSLVAAALVYYVAVRWIHEALDAGPIVLIITALVGIFTIGLGENTDGISAYSVFNRGFQRLLGEVDADELMAQQMGGGLRMNHHHHRHDAPRAGGGNILEPPPPPARRQHAAAAAAAPDENDANNNNNNNDAPNDDDDDDDEAGNDDSNNDDANNNRPRARLSGKKARRRNLEQRRELQRQRQAAQAMGFGGDENAEALAMQQILEEQIAENEAQG